MMLTAFLFAVVFGIGFPCVLVIVWSEVRDSSSTRHSGNG
jgi:general stress protein CsbA